MQKSVLQKLIKELRKAGQESETIDAKRELVLTENGDKAEFVKDIIAMANNKKPSYIIIGVEDNNFSDVGLLTYHYDKNTINQILSDKIDPPVVIDYKEFKIGGNEYALIEVIGDNPPYIVARDIIHAKTDRKQKRVQKGMIFIRHEDRITGISRSELDQLVRSKSPDIKVSFEKEKKKKREPQNHFPLICYVFNKNEIMAQNVEVLMVFDGCTLLKCPDFEHKHVGNHYGDIYEETTLILTFPHLLGNSVSSNIMRFTLVLGKNEFQAISLTIRGGNIPERKIFIELSEIDERFRLW